MHFQRPIIEGKNNFREQKPGFADLFDWPNNRTMIGRAQPNEHISHYRESGGYALTSEPYKHIISFCVVFTTMS